MDNIDQLGRLCCGCGGCADICPTHCITFSEDAEGFLYPQVDETRCVDCGACVRHCPVLQPAVSDSGSQVYAAKSKNRDQSFASTSGGLFVLLAEYVLHLGGLVFGCAYDEQLVATHICIEHRDELYKLQDSKYVQSNTLGVYKQVKDAVLQGRPVLFSGTGCQVGGLKTFLGKEYELLYTVDIICHGVPSPKLFANYIDWLGKKMGAPVRSYSFRNKEKSGWDLVRKADTGTHASYKYAFFDPYYHAFLQGQTYRESCYSCKWAGSARCGDITLGDYWGIEQAHPAFYDPNGVSLVLVNTDRGRRLWDAVSSKTDYIPSTLEKAAAMNHNLIAPTTRPACRDTIYDGYDEDFDRYVRQKLSVGPQLKTRLKRMIPKTVKARIRRFLKG